MIRIPTERGHDEILSLNFNQVSEPMCPEKDMKVSIHPTPLFGHDRDTRISNPKFVKILV